VPQNARVLQVGAGVGYYTAVLRRLAGADGSVVAYEVEAELAARAGANLDEWDGVTVRHGNAATDLREGEAFDFVVAFAGVTHVPPVWTANLAPGARLLLPLTGTTGWGAMIRAQAADGGFIAETVGRCGFYPCADARDDALVKQIDDLFADTGRLDGWRFRLAAENGRVRFDEDV
jgi:protein-L-isoaspartate(D-aspartate) O-methyltransferase